MVLGYCYSLFLKYTIPMFISYYLCMPHKHNQMCTSRAIQLFVTFSLICLISFGQKRYKTDSGQVAFNASTPLEDIQATNQQVNAILKDSGEFAVVLLIREFEFPRKLTLHGVTKEVTVPGTLSRKNRNILLSSTFVIRPEDYEVEIPTLLFKKIAREVTVDFSLLMPPQ